MKTLNIWKSGFIYTPSEKYRLAAGFNRMQGFFFRRMKESPFSHGFYLSGFGVLLTVSFSYYPEGREKSTAKFFNSLNLPRNG